VGVTVTDWVEARRVSVDLSAKSAGRTRLNATMDRRNARCDENAVYFGAAHGTVDAAPMRIAFTPLLDPCTETTATGCAGRAC